MNTFEAIILGIIQGLTEFLPVSSSGHLALLRGLTNIDLDGEFILAFDLLLHIATLISVCLIFRKTILELIRKPFQKLTLFLVIGTVPAVAAALLFGDQIDSLFGGGTFLFMAFTFTLTGCILLFADKAAERAAKIAAERRESKITNMYGGENKTLLQMTWKEALIIGAAQAAAIPPGISRSGTTIAAALGLKFNRDDAARFIFLLSIPAIIGGSVRELVRLLSSEAAFFEGISLTAVAFGFIAAAASGYLAIKFFLALLTKARLRYFSVYVFALAFFIAFDVLVLGGRFLS